MSRRRFRKASRVATPSAFQDEAYRRLTEKLYRWLFQQPEWVHVLASDRHTRKRYGLLIADAVTRIPPYVSDPPPEPRRVNIRLKSQEVAPGAVVETVDVADEAVGSEGGQPPSPKGSGKPTGSTPSESITKPTVVGFEP